MSWTMLVSSFLVHLAAQQARYPIEIAQVLKISQEPILKFAEALAQGEFQPPQSAVRRRNLALKPRKPAH